MPKISVVIPCYNHGAFLDEAVDSVLCQTYRDIEIIIINDGSTDRATIEHLHNYNRPNTIVINSPRYGVSSARNYAIGIATGDYILPLDADDRIAPTYLEKACHILDKDPHVGIVYCLADLFGEKNGMLVLPEFTMEKLLLSNMIFSAALYRKSSWLMTRGYNINMKQGWEDWDFWLSMVQLNMKVFRIPEVLFSYRVNHSSRDNSMKLSHKIKMFFNIVCNHKGLYFRSLPLLLKQLCFKYLKIPAFIGGHKC